MRKEFPSNEDNGDFNADGRMDVAVANLPDNADGPLLSSVAVLPGNGDGTFQETMPFAQGIGPRSLTVGDFDSDGHLDVAVSTQLYNTVAVFLGKGDGTFQDAAHFNAGGEPGEVIFDDFDGDGQPDLAVASLTAATVSVVRNTTDICTDLFTAADHHPPSITSITASPAVLWPPNHKLVAVVVVEWWIPAAGLSRSVTTARMWRWADCMPAYSAGRRVEGQQERNEMGIQRQERQFPRRLDGERAAEYSVRCQERSVHRQDQHQRRRAHGPRSRKPHHLGHNWWGGVRTYWGVAVTGKGEEVSHPLSAVWVFGLDDSEGTATAQHPYRCSDGRPPKTGRPWLVGRVNDATLQACDVCPSLALRSYSYVPKRSCGEYHWEVQKVIRRGDRITTSSLWQNHVRPYHMHQRGTVER